MPFVDERIDGRKYLVQLLIPNTMVAVVSSIVLIAAVAFTGRLGLLASLIVGLFGGVFLSALVSARKYRPLLFHELLLVAASTIFLGSNVLLLNALCLAAPNIASACSGNTLRGLSFANVFFPLIGILASWLLIRLPQLIRDILGRQEMADKA